jgi:hypothetical protein
LRPRIWSRFPSTTKKSQVRRRAVKLDSLRLLYSRGIAEGRREVVYSNGSAKLRAADLTPPRGSP